MTVVSQPIDNSEGCRYRYVIAREGVEGCCRDEFVAEQLGC